MDAASHLPDRSSWERSGRSTTRDLLDVYAPEPNALERRALSFLDGELKEGSVPIRDEERARLGSIQRRTVWIGVGSGTLSGLILGGLEIGLTLGILDGEDAGLLDAPLKWGLFYAVVGIVTLVEVLFLYWITLRAVAKVKRIVGVPPGEGGTGELVRAALARAALESPNPEGKILGVDPHAFEPKWQLLARSLLYRAKVGITSFVLRIAMRRLFVRAVLRSYVPLLAAPLYAAWNALILHRIMEEARVRAFGPFALREGFERMRRHDDEAFRAAFVAGAVELVRCAGNAHPNYVLLLAGLQEWTRSDELAPAGDRGRGAMTSLPEEARDELCAALLMVTVLAGRPSRRQLAYLQELNGWLDRPFPAERLVALRRALRDGERLWPDTADPSPDDEADGAMQLETSRRLPNP